MAKRQSIHLDGLEHHAPVPNAAVLGNILMSSFIGGRDPETGEVPTDLEAEIKMLFANMERILKQAGGSMDDIVKVEFTAKDRSCRSVLDPIWLNVFPDETQRPARHVIEGPMAGSTQLQAEILAVLGN